MTRRLILLLTITLSLCACTEQAGNTPEDKAKMPDAAATQKDPAVLFYENATQPALLNLLYSPLSLQRLMSMVNAGSSGNTRARLEAVFGQQLAQPYSSDELTLAQGLFVQSSYTILADYIELLSNSYSVTPQTVDFTHATQQAGETINQWVQDNTDSLIEKLVEPQSLKPDTRLFLAATALFDAEWETPFLAYNNYQANFKSANKKTTNIKFMKQSTSLAYGKNAEFEVVEMHYKDSKAKLLLALPADEANLTNVATQLLLAQLPPRHATQVYLHLPKVDIEVDFPLTAALEKMGLDILFSQDADFSAITGDKSLYISDAIHKTRIIFNEKGTKAAAAGGVSFAPKSLPRIKEAQVILKLNRPFAFALMDPTTSQILFAGTIGQL